MIALLVSCAIGGSGTFTVPDNSCTPGSYERLNRSEVCTTKERPYLPVAERRAILRNYGILTWSGKDGELDHRVPLFLGGKTDRSNIWPERGPATNNPKDKLENYVRRRICVDKTMRVTTARRWFLVDWRCAYSKYIERRKECAK